MRDLPVNVIFDPPCTDAQMSWLRRTHVPLSAIVFRPSAAPMAEANRLAQLLVHEPTALATSEASLQSVEGLEAQAAMPEQFAAFCRRFRALRRLRLQLPTEHGEQALEVLPAGLQYLGANADIQSLQVR